jgi:L,D-transpeptidase ErfK/SrfK
MQAACGQTLSLPRALGFGGAVAAVLFAWVTTSAPADDLIGEPHYRYAHREDTLLDLARSFDAGYVEMRLANPAIDPWLPQPGSLLALPTWHVLPDAPREDIVINLAELRLYYFRGNEPVRSFPVGIGREGAETRTGRTQVIRRREQPTWIPTPSEKAENPDLPDSVPPGPDNPMGAYALYLGWTSYAMHGTDRPDSVGRRGSHGCIRLYPEDIEQLYPLVAVGTVVTVVDQPVKLGWRGGELYLEIHPRQQDADRVEQGDALRPERALNVTEAVLEAAGAKLPQVDWQWVRRAEQQPTGLPVRITFPASAAD